MSNTIDQRVVEMRFDNSQFEKGIQTSMHSLRELDKSISKQDSAGMSNLANSVEKVSQKFSAMGVAGMAAINRVVNSAFDAGERIVKALTIDPVKTGLEEYETKLNSIQVIKANTRGKNTLDEITDALDELNLYADKTIYNFAQMTSNVGKFVAQGLDVKQATKAIQGMANLAAASGASAEDMSRATYQMSQALGGTIRKIDWNSLRNANMATVELKNTIMDVARNWGIAIDDMIAEKGTFEDTLEKGWLTGDLFTEAMNMYSDVYSEAELKAKGYTDAQIANFKDLAKEANDAATKVKTITQLFDVAKESVQSGWTQTWEYIIGDFNEASDFLTQVSQTFEFFSSRSADARNSLFKEWHDLGGRDELIQALFDTFYGIMQLVQPIKDAFNEIFPPMTAQRLFDICHRIREIAAQFTLTDDAAEGLKNTVKLLLTPIKMVVTLLGQAGKVALVFGKVLWVLTNYVLGLMKDFNGFGNVLKNVLGEDRYTRLIEAWNSALGMFVQLLLVGIQTIFNFISAVKNIPLLQDIFSFAGNSIANGFITLIDKITVALENFSNLNFSAFRFDFSSFKSFGDVVERIKSIATNAKDSLFGFFNITREGSGILQNIVGFLSQYVEWLNNLISKITIGKVAIFAFGLALTALMVKLIKFMDSITGVLDGFGDIGESISKVLKARAFNNNSKAILRIAFAFGVLAASLAGLAFVAKSGGLLEATAALGLLGLELITLSMVLGKFTSIGSSIKLSTTFVALAASLAILTGVLYGLKGLNIDKGIIEKLLVLASVLTVFSVIAALMSKISPKLASGSIMLIAFAYSTKILVDSLVALNDLDLSNSEETILGLSTLIVSIGAFLMLAGRFRLSSALGILAMCASVNLIIDAIKTIKPMIKMDSILEGLNTIDRLIHKFVDFFLNSSWDEILHITVPLAAIAGSVFLIGMGINNIAKALIKVSAAIFIMFKALTLIGKMDPEIIAKGTDTLRTILEEFSSLIAVFGMAGMSIGGGNGGLSGTLGNLTGSANGFGAMIQMGRYASKLGSAMIKISFAVGILVGVMKLMEFLDPVKMQTSMEAIVLLLDTFAIIAAASSFVRKTAPILALGVVVGAIVMAISMLTLIDPKETQTACLSMAAVFTSLALFVASLSKLETKQAVAGVLLFVSAVASVAGAIIVLEKLAPKFFNLEITKMVAIVGSLVGMATGFAIAANILAKAKFDDINHVGHSLMAFLSVATVMGLLVTTLGMFAQDYLNTDWRQLLASTASICAFALAFSSAVLILSKAKFESINDVGHSLMAFLSVATVMGLFVTTLGMFSKDFFAIDWRQMIAGTVSMSALANAFASAVLILSKAKFDDLDKAKSSILAFLAVAGAMGLVMNILTPVFQSLESVEWHQILMSTVAISAITNAFASASLILSKAKFDDLDKAKSAVLAFLAIAGSMSIAMNILAPAFKQLENVKWHQILVISAAISALANAFASASLILSKASFDDTNKTLRSILAFASIATIMSGAMYLLIPTFQKLQHLNMSKILSITLAISALSGAFSGATALLSWGTKFAKGWKEILASSAAIIGLATALRILAPAFKEFAYLDMNQIGRGLLSMAGSLLVLDAELIILNRIASSPNFAKNITKGLIALTALGGDVWIFATALKYLSEIKMDDMIAQLLSLGAVVLTMGIAMQTLSQLDLNTIGRGLLALSGIGADLWIFVTALERMAKIDFGGRNNWDNWLQTLGTLATSVGGLGVFVAIMGELNTMNLASGVAALAAIAAVLALLLVPALEKLSTINIDDFWTIIGFFTAIIAISGVAAGALGALSDISLIGVVAFAALSAILRFMLAPAFDVLSTALEKTVPALHELSEIDAIKLAANLVSLSIGMGLMAASGLLLALGAVGVTAFAASIYMLAAALDTLDTVIESGTYLFKMYEVGANAIDNLLAGLSTGLDSIATAGRNAWQAFIGGFTGTAVPSVSVTGATLGNALGSASSWATGGAKASSNFSNGFKVENQKLGKSYFTQGVSTGKQYVQGMDDVGKKEIPKVPKKYGDVLDKGTKQQAEHYAKIGSETGGYIVSGMSKELQKHAPSKIQTSINDALKTVSDNTKKQIHGTIEEFSPWLANQVDSMLAGVDLDGPIATWLNREVVGNIDNWIGKFNQFKEGFDISETAEGVAEAANKASEGLGGAGSSAKGAGSSAAEAKDEFEDLRSTLASSLDSFEKFDKGAKESGARIIMNLKSQFDGMSEWATMIQQMTAMGFDEKIVKKFAEQGTASYSKVAALIKSTPSEVSAYNYLINKAITFPDNILAKVKTALPKTVDEVSKATKKTTDQVGKATAETTKDVDKATTEIQNDVKDTTEVVKESTEDVTEAQKDLSTVVTDTMKVVSEDAEMSSKLAEMQNKATESTKELTESQKEATDTTKTLGGGVVDLQDILQTLAEVSDDVKEKFIFAFIEMKAKVEEIGIAVHDTVESQMDLFKEFEMKTEMTADQMLNNMRSWITGVTQWSSMLASLGGKLDTGLMQKLAELGPEGYEQVHAFVTMTDEQLKEANALYQQGLLLPDAAANTVMASFQKAGNYMVDGVVLGLNEKQQMAYDQATKLGLDMYSFFAQSLGIHSPSTVMEEAGRNIIEGLHNGVRSLVDSRCFTYMKYIAEKIVNIAKTGLDKGKFYVIGQNVVIGLMDGMKSKLDQLREVAAEIGRVAEEATRASVKVQSPSRVFMGIGEYISIGLAKGIENMATQVSNAAYVLGQNSVVSMESAITHVADVLDVDLDMDTSPVIRPVVDLSNVQNGAMTMTKLMNLDGNVKLVNQTSRHFNAQGATVTSSTNTYDNSNVVNVIEQLRSDIATLSERMGNTQIILDTGVVAGEMTNQLNSRLGKQQIYANRRM